MLAHDVGSIILNDRTHMLECTRCREGSVPSWSDSISSEYAHKPPTSSATCLLKEAAVGQHVSWTSSKSSCESAKVGFYV